MQTFFLTSGFFTARLWRRLGLTAMLRHRFRHLLLPFLLTFATIVPLSTWLYMNAIRSLAQQDRGNNPICVSPEASATSIWCAARNGDVEKINTHLAKGVDIDAPDPQNGLTPLTWAAAADKVKVVHHLLKIGARIDSENNDGGTALHEAASMGQDRVAEHLIRRGANVVAKDDNGETPLQRAQFGWKNTLNKIREWQLVIDLREIHLGWVNVAELLVQHEASGKIPPPLAEDSEHATASEGEPREKDVWYVLAEKETLYHIWFLWFVCLLMPFFVLYAAIAGRWKGTGIAKKLVLSPYRYLWLIPLTMIPQWFMAAQGTMAGFGPDHATAIFPPAHILFYYSIFFFFGVIYYDCDDNDNSVKLGKHWVIALLLGLLLIFPVGMTIGILRFAFPVPGFGLHLSEMQYLISVAMQATFTWVMVFAVIGLFRHMISDESKIWNYISDNAYWLFLFHPPLVILLQKTMRTWILPADIKYIMTILVTLGAMLLIYECLMRYTPMSRLRDGYRQ